MPSHRRKFLKRAAITGMFVGLAGCQGNSQSQDSLKSPESDTNYEAVKPVSWLTLSREDNPTYYEEAQQAQRMLEEIGFTFKESVYESGQWVNTLFAKNYDIANIGWSNTVERLFPYYNLYFSFHSQYAGPDGGNFSNFVSKEYDQTVKAFASEMDDQRRKELAYKCQEILAQNVPVAYTTHPSSLIAHNTNQYTGWKPMVGEWAYFNPTTLKTAQHQGGDRTVILATTSPPEQYPNFMSHTGPAAVFLHKLNYDPLVQMSTTGRPLAEGAAESWEVVDDTTIDVKIRRGMTWHDGEPVTPEDVKFTWDFATEHGIPYLASDIEPYDSSEIREGRTVRFNLKNPFAGFISVSLYRVPIIPKHVWDGITQKQNLDHPGQWENPKMTGSGPFKMVNYEPGNRVVFEKHTGHYHANQYDMDRIVYNIYGTNSTAVGDVIGGAATFTQGLSSTDWKRAKNADSTKAIENPSIQANGLFFNTNNEPFNDLLVRRAMAYALNRSVIADTVHQGHAQAAKSPVAPANKEYHKSDVKAYEFNLQQARSLLEKSGFRSDGDKLVKPVNWQPSQELVNVGK